MKPGDLVQFIIQNATNKGIWFVTEVDGSWCKLYGFDRDPFGGRRNPHIPSAILEVISESR
tara:strand:+ start:1013 stop:1195 length:183 start_codon:yes stop_codon:yes gene_type:complete